MDSRLYHHLVLPAFLMRVHHRPQAKGASKRASSFISVNKELEQAKLLTDLLIFLISFINLDVSYLINRCLLPSFNFLADSVDEEWSQSAVHVYVWSSSAFANFSDVY